MNEKESNKIFEDDKLNNKHEGIIFGIIGFVQLNNEEFICFIKNVEKAAKINSSKLLNGSRSRESIYSIKDVSFYPL